jgi:WbqC-like protein family
VIQIIEYQYFGNIVLYNTLCNTKHIIFEQYENYQKSSFRNKIAVPSPQGLLHLSIPILGGRGIKQNIKDVVIDNRQDWKTNHFKTICNIYNRSPWFEFYKNELKNLYEQPIEKLVDWNLQCFNWTISKLKIAATVSKTKNFDIQYDKEEFIDLRNLKVNNSTTDKRNFIKYHQVFEDSIGFIPNVCILDLLFCEGPNAINFLSNPL